MKNGRSAGPDDRERLERFLEWRRSQGEGGETPSPRWLPYVAAIAWLGVGVLTGAIITTLTAGERDARAPLASASPPAPVAAPVAPGPRKIPAAARTPSVAPVSMSRPVPAARPTPVRVPAAGPGRPERPAPAMARKPALLTTVAGTLERWIGFMPEVRAGKAIVRWVKSRPRADTGPRPPEPDRPQAR